MPHITPTERREQRKRDYAVQIAGLQKQAWDGCCEVVSLRMDERGDGYCVVRFSLFPRGDDSAFTNVRAAGDTFPEAFKRVCARLPAAIADVTADAAFRAECRGDDDAAEAKRERRERIAEERWEELRNDGVAS